MRYSIVLASLIVASFADDRDQADVDMDDVPNPCKTICRPLATLSDRCDTDLKNDNDRDEHRLQNQCICTNKSFDVAKIAGLCADCMHQTYNNRHDGDDGDDDDDDEDDDDDDDDHADSDDIKHIDRFLTICGFTQGKYTPDQTSAVNGINVQATPATNINQLTTTFNGGSGGAPTNAPQQTTSSSGSQPTDGATGGSGTTPQQDGGKNGAGSLAVNLGAVVGAAAIAARFWM